MKFSYNWLQSFFGRQLPDPQKLAEILTLHFAEVEEVKNPPAGGGNDFVLDIDVRPNRATDCFSHIGVAKEISAITGLKFKKQSYKITEDRRRKATDFLNIKLQGRGPCARYTARILDGVKIGSSPKWMQERLIACGLRPINNVVDAANYVMLEYGQPLHAFDFDKLAVEKSGNRDLKKKTIIVRMAKAGEKIITLDGNKYDLNDDILIIADAEIPLAIAGIKGGKKAEIDDKTKIIAIESANFNQQIVRRASQKLELKTDASVRFEHGVNPNLTTAAVDRAASLIQKIAGGKIIRGFVDIYPRKVFPKSISLDSNYVSSLLGMEIPRNRIINILESLGFKISSRTSRIIKVIVPTLRSDVSIPGDLVEEVGRIYGYEKIPSNLPKIKLAVPEINFGILWENIVKGALKEAGFNEVYNYSFVSRKDTEAFGFDVKKLIEVENPLSSDFQFLRPNLLINLLKNAERNQKNFPHIKIFELGRVFSAPNHEQRTLTGVILNDVSRQGKANPGQEFYAAKGTIDLLLNRLGISDIWYDDYRTQYQDSKILWWHPKKSAEIKTGQERIGFLGEISPKILGDFKISSKAVYFDIFFEKLLSLANEEHEYRPISKFPAAVRDIAVLVPRLVKVEDVLDKIETAGGKLIRDVDLFDIYEGDELPDQKKNLAFHIIYQSEEKTLQSEEIDKVQDRIIAALERVPEWQVRR